MDHFDEGKSMNLDINDKNLYLLLPGKVSRVVQMYAHEHHVTLVEALVVFIVRILTNGYLTKLPSCGTMVP